MKKSVTTCAQALQIDFDNFLRYSQDTKEAFVRGYLTCLTKASHMIENGVTSEH